MLIVERFSLAAVPFQWREVMSKERRYEMKARKYVDQNRVAAFVGFTLILVLVIGLAIIIPFASPVELSI